MLYSAWQDNLRNYFSNSLQETFHKLDKPLKSYLKAGLLGSFSSDNFEIATLVLKISKKASETLKTQAFLLALLKTPSVSLKVQLEKVVVIYKRKGEQLLHNALKTENIVDRELAISVIDTLFQLALSTEKDLRGINLLDRFDRGGKEFLLKIFRDVSEVHAMEIDENLSTNSCLNLFLQSEENFEALLLRATDYLKTLKLDQKLSSEIYEQFFDHLRTLSYSNGKAILKMAIACTTRERKALERQDYTLQDLKNLSVLACKIAESWDGEALIPFYRQEESLDEVLSVLQSIVDKTSCIEKIYEVSEIFSQLIGGALDISTLFKHQLRTVVENDPDQMAFAVDVSQDLEKFIKEVPSEFALDPVQLTIIGEHYEAVLRTIWLWEGKTFTELLRLGKEIRHSLNNSIEVRLDLTALGILAIRHFYKMSLYPVQILSVLAFLNYEKGCIGQIKTGQGKSKIITLLTFVLAMQGVSVHSISSSPHLSKRDQEDAEEFFKSFEISSAYIGQGSYEKEKFAHQILYGTATQFQFAVMHEILNGITFFPEKMAVEKRYPCVIVDEFDSLSLDSANQSSRMALTSEDSVEWIYKPIFDFFKNDPSQSKKLRLESLPLLRKTLQEQLGKRYQKQLSNISDEQMIEWANSCLRALYQCQQDVDYILLNDQIHIVDISTGNIQVGMRWSQGLHEFVEIKHHLKPFKESLTPISLSHFPYYKMYERIYGLTGTLGSQIERQTIKLIFNLDTFDVPTHKLTQRKDEPLKLIATQEQFLQKILEQVETCQQERRPLLLLCQTIKDTLEMSELLSKHRYPHNVWNEMQAKMEQEIMDEAGLAKAITVATNIAGRGTDIKLSEEVILRGGLHVLLTFCPESERVEQQARGRAGRQGQKGSSAMIVSMPTLNLPDMYAPEIKTHFQAQRQKLALALKHNLLLKAELEQNIFTIVFDFFKHANFLKKKITDEDLLNHLARFLNVRKIKTNYPIKKQANSPQEALLADDLIAMCQVKTTEEQWINVLRRLAQNIEYQIMKEASSIFEQFHKRSHGMDLNPRITFNELSLDLLNSARKNGVAKALSTIEMMFEEAKRAGLEEFKQEMMGEMERFLTPLRAYDNPLGHYYYQLIARLTGIQFHI